MHRIRWADPDGTARPVLVTAPLSGPAAEPPAYRDAVPVYWYRPNDRLRRTVTDAGQGVVHGLLVKPWGGAPGDAAFTASLTGVHVHRYLRRGVELRDRRRRRPGAVAGQRRERGGGGPSRRARLRATIEPWHGPQVVVYREDGGAWEAAG